MNCFILIQIPRCNLNMCPEMIHLKFISHLPEAYEIFSVLRDIAVMYGYRTYYMASLLEHMMRQALDGSSVWYICY